MIIPDWRREEEREKIMGTETRKKGNITRWWLQLQFAFFSDKRVRALRRKYGDLALIIYQKMMLKSLENKCSMKYEGLEDTFEEEIAVDIIEDESEKVFLIKEIVQFLIDHDLMVEQEDNSYFFPQAAQMSGSETDSAERMRKKRERDKEKASQCDGEALLDIDGCDDSTSHCEVIRTETDTETDLHLNSDKSKSLDVKSKTDTDQACAVSDSADRPAGAAAAKGAAPQSDDLFSVKQLLAIVEKNKVNLTGEGVQTFHEEMQESGWMLYDRPVEKKGIVKALRGWAKYHPEYSQDQAEPERPKVEKPKPAQRDFDLEFETKMYNSICKKTDSYMPLEMEIEYSVYDLFTHIPDYCPKDIFTDEELDYLAEKYNLEWD